MNSFIRTSTGLTLVIDNKPYVVAEDHPNYGQIVTAIRNKTWDIVPALIDTKTEMVQYITTNELAIDEASGVVTFRGVAVDQTIATHIIKMKRDGFDITPIERYLNNLYNNPSNKAIRQLYGWQAANGFTITDDGYLVAYKRVRDDYRSFYDGSTLNLVGTVVSMPRNAVDDRSEQTCSHGLHFCAHSYLPHYAGGKGRILILKINPADVVSIPTDYNNAKGRACAYYVQDELVDDARRNVETKPVVTQSVLPDTQLLNECDDFKQHYRKGYADGRSHKSKRFPEGVEAIRGYKAGYSDGRNKRPNLHATEQDRMPASADLRIVSSDPVFIKVAQVLGEYGVYNVTPTTNLHETGLDSLDFIELIIEFEDEFGVDVEDAEAERCVTPEDIVQLIRSKRGY